MDIAYLVGVIIGSIVAGLIIGAIPFVIGYKKNMKNLGIAAIITCVVGHFIYGLLLSIPACVIFIVIILVKSKNAPSNNNTNNE